MKAAAGGLLTVHSEVPRAVRYLADIQRWMLSQGTLAVHFEHKLDPSKPPLTPTNLLRFLEAWPIAGKNTILSFLREIRHYKLVDELEGQDKRQTILRATDYIESLIRIYVDIHLRALDETFGGSRYALSQMYPELLYHAQPAMTRLLLAQPQWRSPSDAVALFSKVDSGSNILHELMSKAPEDCGDADKVWIGAISSTHVAENFLISQSHTARVFSRARGGGLMGWERPHNRGNCWLSSRLVQEYRYWQAVKFSMVSLAAEMAARQVLPLHPERQTS